MESTSQTINQQVSRQTSTASTTRRVSDIHEEDLSKTQRKASAAEEFHPAEGILGEEVVVQKRDAQTMTTPDIEEQVGRDKYLRLNSFVSDIVAEPDEIEELRGVPIEPRTVGPQIQEVIKSLTNSSLK